MGIHPTYGSNDVRKLNNLDQLFDGVYNNFVEFSDYAHKDGHVTLKLGSERTIKKIRAYIQDGTQNYLRDTGLYYLFVYLKSFKELSFMFISVFSGNVLQR